MFFLTTGLIKAWFRVVLICVFSCQSFFYVAQNMFPDGYECWEPGHVVFCAYVMERIEQDHLRKEAEQGAQPHAMGRGGQGVPRQCPKVPSASSTMSDESAATSYA